MRRQSRGIVTIVIVMLAIGFLLSFRVVIVSGQSMAPTLRDKTLLLAYRNREISKGDIAIAHVDGETIIKRVLATGGDEVRQTNGILLLNGVELAQYKTEGETEYLLGDNEVYLLGDNASNSLDSRVFGPISLEQVKGRVLFVT